MKNIKKFELVIWLMLCLQASNMYAAQESKQDVDGERQELIAQTVENHPLITQTFHDFLEQNLSRNENEEDNFEQVIGQAEDLITKHMKDTFIATLQQSIEDKKSLDQFENPLFRYVMHYKDGSMKNMVRQWLREWSAAKDMNSLPYRGIFHNRADVTYILISPLVDFCNQDKLGNTPLHEASLNENIEVVQMLIDAGADLNSKNSNGDSPLYKTAQFNIIKIVEMLIKSGADINSKNNDGYTPLHRVALHNNIKILQMLIEAGADLNIKNKHGYTPLHWAAVLSNVKAVNILINAGANLNFLDDASHEQPPRNYTNKMKAILVQAQQEKELRNRFEVAQLQQQCTVS